MKQTCWLHTGKRGIRYPHIQTTDVSINFFLNYRLNRNRAQRLFFAALHQCCTALHKSCLSTIWLFFCIFMAALLQLSVSLPQRSQKWTATANGKQLSYNLSAALVAALISHYSSAVLTSSVSYRWSTFCNNILCITFSISGRCWMLRSNLSICTPAKIAWGWICRTVKTFCCVVVEVLTWFSSHWADVPGSPVRIADISRCCLRDAEW